MARKQELCTRAEALAGSTEWDSAAAELQAPPGGLEDGGPGAAGSLGGDLAALPDGL